MRQVTRATISVMNKRTIVIGTVLVMAMTLSVPMYAKAQTVNQFQVDSAYRTALLELIAVLQQQILVLQQELERRQVAPDAATVSLDRSDEIEVVAAYEIEERSEVAKIAKSTHRTYFERVFTLMPPEYSDKFSSLRVFTGDDIYFDAFVETLPPKFDSWRYSVHEDALVGVDQLRTDELIVHELGHVVSLEALPGTRNRYNGTCSSYFEYNGNSCPPTNSYLAKFVDTFWTETDLLRAKGHVQAQDVLGSVRAYYRTNIEEYVTEYAALGPEEDFAEAFMYFVLSYDTDGEAASQKIAFFAQFQELSAIKAYVQERL